MRKRWERRERKREIESEMSMKESIREREGKSLG